MSRKQPQKKFQFDMLWKNNVLLSFMAGLVAGLMIAVIIAIIITRSPMPFNSKMNKQGKPAMERRTFSDPNEPMYTSKDAARENYKKSIAEAAIITELATKNADSNTPLSYIQAGAYRDKKEAENMRARLALLGLEASIKEVKTQNSIFYRVRLGPYTQKNLGATQEKLRKSGIEFTTSRS